MGNTNDFKISKGVLRQYTGSGGTVVVPVGVVEIGKQAFMNCDGLREITFPDTVREIQSDAFKFCRGLRMLHINEGLQRIAMSAFEGCSSLQSVCFPASLEKIGGFAFGNCTALERVEFSEGLQEIGDSAFSACLSLKELFIPESVRKIGMCAFYNCENLSRIWLSEKTHLELEAFRFCKKLLDTEGFLIVDRTLYYYEHNRPEVIVPAKVSRIGEGAFYCRNAMFTRVRLHDGITHIGSNSFRNKATLTDMNIPASVETIDTRAFYECRNLDVCIEGSPRLGKEVFEGVHMIVAPQMEFSAFDSAGARTAALRGYLKHRGLYSDAVQCEAYGKYAVGQRKKLLPEILKNDDVDTLAYFAEIGCIKASNFEAEYMAPTLKADAVNCKAFLLDWRGKHLSTSELEKQEMLVLSRDPFSVMEMKKLWSYEELEDGNLMLTSYKGEETEVLVPNRIGKRSVTKLGDNLFSIFQRSGNSYYRDGKWKPIGRRIALNKIETIEITEGITHIGEAAFAGRDRLETVILPESVTYIGSQAFVGCVKMAENGFIIVRDVLYGYTQQEDVIEIPNHVKEISDYALHRNYHVKVLMVPDGVTRIGCFAFRYCVNLNVVHIPSSVCMIGEGAFDGCRDLTVYGAAGSYAEQYAQENNIPFFAVKEEA